MADGEQIVFQGKDGTEAENLIRSVKAHAFKLGKQRDNDWMAAFASICFAGNALRWFETLDQATQLDWKLLSAAILVQYPAVPMGASTSRGGPDIGSSFSGQPEVGGSSISTTVGIPPRRPSGPRASLPSPPLPNIPSTPSHHRTSSTSATAPPITAAAVQTTGPPGSAGPSVPSFIAARLTPKARDVMNVQKIKGTIRILKAGSTEDFYVSIRATTLWGESSFRGYHFASPYKTNRLEVEHSPSIKSHGLNILSPSGNLPMLGLTWFEKSPQGLGTQEGDLGYAHLVDADQGSSGTVQTSLKWNGRLPDHHSWEALSEETATDVWKIGSDGTLHASWVGPYGVYPLWPVIDERTEEILFVVDYDMFMAAHDGRGFIRARLVFEEK